MNFVGVLFHPEQLVHQLFVSRVGYLLRSSTAILQWGAIVKRGLLVRMEDLLYERVSPMGHKILL